MPLLVIDNVTKYYGAELILEGVSLAVDERDRVGLIGANGTGKTTLCRAILGELELEDGRVNLVRGTTTGYLAQGPAFPEGQTLWEAAMECFSHLKDLEGKLASLEEQMSHPGAEDLDAILGRHERVRHEYEQSGGYEYETRAATVLTGLGLAEAEFQRPIDSFSGGEKSRAALATLLLTEPDLLLLDEPTNHLDIQGTEWLEEYLRGYRGAVIAISHDRRFLNAVAGRIVEVVDHELDEYTGNYDDYIRQKEDRLLNYQRVYKTQQRERKRQLAFIRWALGTCQEKRVRAAKSRMKLLDKVEWLDPPAGQRRKMNLRFAPRIRGGDEIAELDDVAVGYGEPLVEGVDLFMRRGDRVGMVGPNGCGKTTILKVILGQLQPLSGRARLGTSVDVGYFAQGRFELDPENTVIEDFREVVSDASIGELRHLLARFLFVEEDVFKNVGRLSGGEQSRLALAKLIMTRPTFLVLDEPTNHLDIDSRGALEGALNEYTGTLLVVSHDRYFLDAVVSKTLAIEDGAARLFDGNYSASRETLRAEAEARELAEAERGKLERRARLDAEKQARKARNERQATIEASSEFQLEQRADELEQRAADLERRVAGMEMSLAMPGVYGDAERVTRLNIEHHRLRAQLQETYQAWEEVMSRLQEE